MNKSLRITINLIFFILIAGFGYYITHSIVIEKKENKVHDEIFESGFVSPYKKIRSFDALSPILCFDVFDNKIFVVLTDKVSVFDLLGNHQYDFLIKQNVRDFVVDNSTIYLLYPTRIDSYNLKGLQIDEWEACSYNSDYCAITTTQDYIFVTDAKNKHIVQYNKQGQFVRFFNSPNGFIIPSYSFDIIHINDTIYCANSGRHTIESYTLSGEYISSFGKTGGEAGAFSGCCNPVYLEKNSVGQILTSEKGNPRISCFEKDGKFNAIFFDSNMLGGGTSAYKIRFSEENIYISNGKTVLVFGIEDTK